MIIICISTFLIETIECQQKIIRQQIIRHNGVYLINLVIGIPSQYIPMSINQRLYYTWTTTVQYDKSLSTTGNARKGMNYFYDEVNHSFAFEDMDDQLIFPDKKITIDNYNFHIVQYQYKNKFDLGYAFGYNFDSDTNSIVHSLKNQRVIDYLSYAIDIDDTTAGKMYIGGVPQDRIEDKPMGKCKVNQSQLYWSCDISRVTIMNNTEVYYDRTVRGSFQAAIEFLTVSEDFMSFLTRTIFHEYIQNKQCTFHGNTKRKYIDCASTVLGNLPMLGFNFGNCLILLDMNEIWWKDELYYELLIYSHEDDNEWIFGNKFMKNIIMNFDYEQSEILFYSSNRVIVNQNTLIVKAKSMIKNCYFFIICICLLGIFLMGYYYTK